MSVTTPGYPHCDTSLSLQRRKMQLLSKDSQSVRLQGGIEVVDRRLIDRDNNDNSHRIHRLIGELARLRKIREEVADFFL